MVRSENMCIQAALYRLSKFVSVCACTRMCTYVKQRKRHHEYEREWGWEGLERGKDRDDLMIL